MTPETARVLLHAFIDGELDAASTIELKAQIDVSPALRQELARLSALQSSVQTLAARFNAPPQLTQRLFAALPAAQPEGLPVGIPSWWRTLAIGTTATAMALLIWNLSSTFVSRGDNSTLLEEVVSAHVRSLMADHLTDLTSMERHSVKPWLSNRLDFAPPVHDFASEGFSLVGGRLDYVGGKPTAAIVYRYRQHLINVFAWPSAESNDSPIRISNHRGYNSTNFNSGGMSYWTVSDLNSDDLRKLANLLQQPPK
ncbi:MAG TPA: anti-sigma factor [Candidatus Binatia bacterium]